MESKRSILHVYNQIFVLLCIWEILKTVKFAERLIFARSVTFQIDDVTSTHFNAHYIKTEIITNTFILQQLCKILGDFNDMILKS